MFWYTEKKVKPYFDNTQWHTWFAWYPVVVSKKEIVNTIPETIIKKWVWWEKVERRWIMIIIDNRLSFWEYRQ